VKLGSSSGTKMSESALAVCLAPTLYSRDVLDSMDAMSAAKCSLQMHRAVSDIVARRNEIFPEPYEPAFALPSTSNATTLVASPRANEQQLSMNVVGSIPVAGNPPFQVIIIQCKSEVPTKTKERKKGFFIFF
jgi:hypothetical protein